MKGQFGEPWVAKKYGSGYGNKSAVPIYANGNQVASAEYLGGTAAAETNGARIVACVNSMSGIPDPVDAVERAKRALKAALAVTEPEGARATSNIIRAALAALGDGK